MPTVPVTYQLTLGVMKEVPGSGIQTATSGNKLAIVNTYAAEMLTIGFTSDLLDHFEDLFNRRTSRLRPTQKPKRASIVKEYNFTKVL